MCDPSVILRLYENVLNESLDGYNVKIKDVKVGIRNMKKFYKPNPNVLALETSEVANYNDDAHRCAYLHKFAPFHTALVSEMMTLASNFILPYLFQTNSRLKLCCLGGGPGSDAVGILAALHSELGPFRCSVTMVDIMPFWIYTFESLIQELRSGGYGTLSDCFGPKYFDCCYLSADLLGKMDNQVNEAVRSATIVTMIKFVSAAACKDTAAMISNIFRTMEPGALVFYIDNAVGGFYQLVDKAARENNFVSIFGPLKDKRYRNEAFKTKRFGCTSCFKTRVTVQILMKPMNVKIARNIPDKVSLSPMNANGRKTHIPVQNHNQLKADDKFCYDTMPMTSRNIFYSRFTLSLENQPPLAQRASNDVDCFNRQRSIRESRLSSELYPLYKANYQQRIGNDKPKACSRYCVISDTLFTILCYIISDILFNIL